MVLLALKRLYYSLRARRWYDKRRKRFARLKRCWDTSHIAYGQDWRQQEFLVVDCETSALDPSHGELLSVGWVVIRHAAVLLGSGEHHLIKNRESVGQSAAIHQLRDSDLEQGLSPLEVFERFLQRCENRILVFHHAPLDLAFLNKASLEVYGAPLLLPVVDTLALEKHKLLHHGHQLDRGVLRLGACRARYNLPPYPAHNALMDALATAELFVAQMEYKGKTVKVRSLF